MAPALFKSSERRRRLDADPPAHHRRPRRQRRPRRRRPPPTWSRVRGSALAGGDLALGRRRRHLRQRRCPRARAAAPRSPTAPPRAALRRHPGQRQRGPPVTTRVDAARPGRRSALSLPGVLVSAIVQLAGGRLVVGTRDGARRLAWQEQQRRASTTATTNGAHWTAGTGAGTGAVAGIAFNGTNALVALTTNGTTAAALHQRRRHHLDGGLHHRRQRHRRPGQLPRRQRHASSSWPPNDKLLQSTDAAGGYSFGAADRQGGERLGARAARSSTTSRSPSIPPTPCTSSSATPAAAKASSRAPTAAACGSCSNDGLFAAQIDFADQVARRLSLRRQPHRLRLVRRRRARRAVDRASIAPSDVDARSGLGARLRQRRSQARRRRAVEPRRPGGAAPPARRHPDRRRHRAVRAQFAWQDADLPRRRQSAHRRPARRRHDASSPASRARRTPPAGQYLYHLDQRRHELERSTSLSAVGGVRALAFDPSQHATIYAGAGDFKDSFHTVAHAGGLWKSTDGGAT